MKWDSGLFALRKLNAIQIQILNPVSKRKYFQQTTQNKFVARTPLLQVANKHTYQRHRPEQTLLYQLVEQYYPDFIEHLSHQGKSLPRHVEKEFEEFLKCGSH